MTESIAEGRPPRGRGLRFVVGWIATEAEQQTCFHAALHNIKGGVFRGLVIEGLTAMRRPDQHDPSRNNASHGTSIAAWLPVLAAMGIMVTGCLSTFLVLQLDEFRPKVGDIVAFKPGSQDSDMWQVSIPAHVLS